MQKRFFPKLIVVATAIVFLYSCTKLDTTTLGEDLVTIDNVNTFADTIEVITTQGIFSNPTGNLYDSTMQSKTDIQYLGNITEPNFGKTEAAIYLQLKPTFYPFYFGNAGDTVKGSADAKLDSVFLCLSPRLMWGDSSMATSIPQTIEVRAINDALFRDKTDSMFGLRYSVATNSTVLGTATLTPKVFSNKTYFGKPSARDSVENQIRIKITNTAFINSLYNQDSTTTAGAPNNGFNLDSIFKKNFNGFEIKSISNGNTLYGVNLADGKTRLEFHYLKKNGIKDTVMQAFFMSAAPNLLTGLKYASSVTNKIKRDYSGSAITTGLTTTNAYLQSAPGTFINISAPGLSAYRNKMDKIVHRAYLQVDQNDGAVASKFSVPPYLYLDLRDSLDPNKYMPLFFDLNSQISYNPNANFVNPLYHPFPNSNIEFGNYGGRAMDRSDAGIGFKRYEINMTRYVQHIISNNYYNHDMRLFAPYNYFYRQYLGNQYIIPFVNPLASGSVRVGAGEYSVNQASRTARRMKLIVIYSKVK